MRTMILLMVGMFFAANALADPERPEVCISGRVVRVVVQHAETTYDSTWCYNHGRTGTLPLIYTCPCDAYIRTGHGIVRTWAYIDNGQRWTFVGDSVVCCLDSLSRQITYTDHIIDRHGSERPARF
jgi:hypothetical protein